MTEVDDEGVELAADLFDALDEFRHARARHDHVFVELHRAEAFDRGRERTAHVPEFLFILARRGAQHVVAAALAHNLFNDLRRAFDLCHVPVNRDEQERARVRV